MYTVYTSMFIATFSDIMPEFVQNRKIEIQIANSRCDIVSCLPQFICFAVQHVGRLPLKNESDELLCYGAAGSEHVLTGWE